LFPFVFVNNIFEGAKIVWFTIGSFFLFVYWIGRLYKKGYYRFIRADFLYFLWLVVLFTASLKGPHPIGSILGGSYRHQGVLFFFALWVVGKTFALLSNSQKELFKKGLIVVVGAQALIIIFQKIFGATYPRFLLDSAPIGTLGEPNAAASFLATGSILLTGSIPLLLIAVALYFTKSITSQVIFLFVLVSTKLLKKKAVSLKTVFACFGALLMLGTYLVLQNRDFSFESRHLIWKLGLESAIEKPLVGFGAESGEFVYEKIYKKTNLPLHNLIIDRSHNLLIDLLLWSGSVGLLLFTLWLVDSVKQLVNKKLVINIVGLMALGIYSFFQPLGVVHWLILMILIFFELH